MMANKSSIETHKNIDIRTVDPDTLIDICNVKVNAELPKQERLLDFVEQIKNPYFFKCGGMVIESVFSENDITLTDKLQQYLRMT